VFEGWLTDSEAATIFGRCLPLLDADTDSLRLYPLCGGCQKRILSAGGGGSPEPQEEVVV
jgi:CRISPR/Cas system-associated endoribonuclease Cas2